MCRHLVAPLVLCFLVAGCSSLTFRQVAQLDDSAALAESVAATDNDLVVAEPVMFENLAIFPILSKMPKNEDRFITLDEGLAAGTVKVVEVGAGSERVPCLDDEADEPDVAQDENLAVTDDEDLAAQEDDLVQTDTVDDQEQPGHEDAGDSIPSARNQPASVDDPFGDGSDGTARPSGEVNTLLVLNTSNKPLYLMPGEVISGGLQDRTIGEEVVIQPGKAAVPIAVFCVEHGRWSGRSLDQMVELLTAVAGTEPVVDNFTALTTEARRGKFVAPIGQLNKDARLAVQHRQSQTAVWDEVAKVNLSLVQKAKTGSFSEVYAEPAIADRLGLYIQSLHSVVDTDRIVGVVVAVNGRVISADVFESTPLFRKFWPKLLKSYALDAIAASTDDEHNALPARVSTVEDCAAFLREAVLAHAESDAISDDQMAARRESDHSISFSYYDRRPEEADVVDVDENHPQPRGLGGNSGMGGGIGGAVHSGAFAK